MSPTAIAGDAHGLDARGRRITRLIDPSEVDHEDLSSLGGDHLVSVRITPTERRLGLPTCARAAPPATWRRWRCRRAGPRSRRPPPIAPRSPRRRRLRPAPTGAPSRRRDRASIASTLERLRIDQPSLRHIGDLVGLELGLARDRIGCRDLGRVKPCGGQRREPRSLRRGAVGRHCAALRWPRPPGRRGTRQARCRPAAARLRSDYRSRS